MNLSNILGTVTVLMCISFSNQQDQNSVTQIPSELKETERNSVSLECTYTTSYSYYRMLWYKQSHGRALTFLFSKYSDGGGSNQAGNRFSVDFRKSTRSISLKISDLQLSDSAVYLCALAEARTYPGIPWYTRVMIFGSGTPLTVTPREQTPSTPSVFVLISDDVKNSTAACLAKNFYPDTLTMSMNSSFGESVESQKVQGALSKSGKYTAVRIHTFKQRGDVQCSASHEGKPIHSYGVATQSDPKPSSSPLPKSTCKPEPRSINTDVKNMEKVNMLSLTVLGLRVLFAKSLAFNVLLSVRLIAF